MLTASHEGNASRSFWHKVRGKLGRAEWLGQTAASLCWIASMLAYGVSSSGDWLQLSAASAWLLANISAIVKSEENYSVGVLQSFSDKDEHMGDQQEHRHQG